MLEVGQQLADGKVVIASVGTENAQVVATSITLLPGNGNSQTFSLNPVLTADSLNAFLTDLGIL